MPTPANKRIRCRHHGPVLFIGAASPTANPAPDPPTSRPIYPRDREVPLACLVLRVSAIGGLRCVVGVCGHDVDTKTWQHFRHLLEMAPNPNGMGYLGVGHWLVCVGLRPGSFALRMCHCGNIARCCELSSPCNCDVPETVHGPHPVGMPRPWPPQPNRTACAGPFPDLHAALFE